jgi:CheY-like chemotaxis protein
VSTPTKRQILVVEDAFLVAMDLHMLLSSAGYDVIGPVASVGKALGLIDGHPVDAALLDINLSDGSVFPAADALAARDIPFVFLTGHSNAMLPPQHHCRALIAKPYSPGPLLAALAAALAATNGRPPLP